MVGKIVDTISGGKVPNKSQLPDNSKNIIVTYKKYILATVTYVLTIVT